MFAALERVMNMIRATKDEEEQQGDRDDRGEAERSEYNLPFTD